MVLRDRWSRPGTGRSRIALLSAAAVLAFATEAGAEGHLLNVELAGGAGLSAWNGGSESLLAPPFAFVQAAYLFEPMGPVQLGPALAIPVGFYRDERGDEGEWLPQVAVRPGVAVYGRPGVDYAWSVVGGPSFVVTPRFAWGLEVGGAFTYYVLAGFGLIVGVDYGFFYGVDPVHVFTGRLGLAVSWEVAS